MTIIDWIWWSVGSVIGLGGIALTIWALFAGRSRGRRRCPKCWYEMTGVEGLRCPECGREVKRERRLLRTRRRWRVALLGMLVIIAGGGCFFGQQVHQKGWIEATPSIVYIVGLPWLDHDTSFDELKNRINNGELTSWECWYLVHRCIGRLESETDPERLAELCAMLATIEQSWMNRRRSPWASYTRVSDIDIDGAAAALAPLIDHEDRAVRVMAMRCLEALRPSPRVVVALLGGLASDNAETREQARSALTSGRHRKRPQGFMAVYPIWPRWVEGEQLDRSAPLADNDAAADICRRIADRAYDHSYAADLFRIALDNADATVRRLAIVGLASVGDHRDADLKRILELYEDGDELVRRAVVGATSLFPFDDGIRRVLERGLHDWAVRHTANEVIGLHGEAARSFLPDLESIVRDPNRSIVNNEIRSLIRIGGSREFAMQVLLDRCDRDRQSLALNSQLRMLAEIGIRSEALVERFEPYLVHEDELVRGTAAHAYAVAGGNSERATRIAIEAYLAHRQGVRTNLISFAESGHMSVGVLRGYLGTEGDLKRSDAVYYLGASGRAAASVLPDLRRLADESDYVRSIEHAIRRIEWDIEHPD